MIYYTKRIFAPCKIASYAYQCLCLKSIIFYSLRPLGACPLLCGGHGDYLNGECECHPGWKGRECSLRHDECEVSDCSGRGHCQDGKCICMQGFAGEFCEKGMMKYQKTFNT